MCVCVCVHVYVKLQALKPPLLCNMSTRLMMSSTHTQEHAGLYVTLTSPAHYTQGHSIKERHTYTYTHTPAQQ